MKLYDKNKTCLGKGFASKTGRFILSSCWYLQFVYIRRTYEKMFAMLALGLWRKFSYSKKLNIELATGPDTLLEGAAALV